jgi:hypothetical protein
VEVKAFPSHTLTSNSSAPPPSCFPFRPLATKAKIAELSAAQAEHDKRERQAGQAEARATGTQSPLLDKTKQLKAIELKASGVEFEATRAKFKYLVP